MMRKVKVLDIFSGAGGFSCGFKMAGCEIIGAIEQDKWAADTFSYNHPSASMLLGDIKSFSEKCLNDSIKDKPDIIIGGPPCQGFSVCLKNAGDPKDPRNTLFTEFLRMATIFNPAVMVMENVPNIIRAKTGNGETVISIIRREFERLGYFVYYAVLSASDYGVPQNRKRLILTASKAKLAHPFPEASHSAPSERLQYSLCYGSDSAQLMPCPTLWEAISDLPDIEAGGGAETMPYTKPAGNIYQEYCRNGSAELHNHSAMKHTKRLVERFSRMSWGQSVSDIDDDSLKQRKRDGNGAVSASPYDQNNRRMSPDRICNTITASFYGNFVHPYKNRNFTPREGARIQSFPDTYIFLGKPTVVSKKLLMREGRAEEAYLCQYSQIGNAVPPLMAKAIAENITAQLGDMN
ncbi:MAG: DNA cytosine methyltransferase [Synergistaceae bacterium]|nr:DNA cytosine methyltransferase [Synergistaceae bacterium]MBQ7170570.1 DNA cytosine methyltransferase [Synergistaceae bacterium]